MTDTQQPTTGRLQLLALDRPLHEPGREHEDSLLRQLLASIAGTWPAVTFHPDDPDAARIHTDAIYLGLTPVPDPTVGYRQVYGVPLPPIQHTADAVTALTGAVIAVATNPLVAAACSPTDPNRHRHQAQELLTHLELAGWHLARTTAPVPADNDAGSPP